MYRSVSVIMMIMIKGLLYKLVLLLSFLSNMHVCCARVMLTLAGILCSGSIPMVHVVKINYPTACIIKAPQVLMPRPVEIPKLHNIKLLIAFIHMMNNFAACKLEEWVMIDRDCC